MTLSELQEMASRQQQQIESQQQILVAKEQRLKYLKQQEQKHQQMASENDRLRKLRDKVEAQELKLKKLRSLRGQVEQQKASNGNLNYELESIKALFNEKEKELAMAVTKVEEMTRQLEEIRSGRVKVNTNNHSPAAMAELEKLKKELMIRNKLNEQQNSKMAANRELLMKRKDEVARMDNRIHELQMRLKKKRAMNSEMIEKNKNQINKTNTVNKTSRPAPTIAAVEPYVPETTTTEEQAGFGKKDPKYQSLPPSSKLSYSDKGNRVGERNNNSVDYSSRRYEQDKTEEYSIPLVVSVDSNNKPIPNGVPSPKQSPKGQPPPYSSAHSVSVPQSVPSSSTSNNSHQGPSVPARSVLSNLAPRPFGSTYSTAIVPNRGTGGVPNEQPQLDMLEEVRQSGSGQSSPGSVESLQNGTNRPSPPQYPGKDSQIKGHGQQRLQPTTSGSALVPSKGPPVPSRPSNRLDSQPYTVNSQGQNIGQQQSSNTENNSDTEQACISVSKGIKKFSGMIANQSAEHVPRPHGLSTGGFSNLNHASALPNARPAPTYRYASKSVIANTYLIQPDKEALEKYQKQILSLHRDLNANSAKADAADTAVSAKTDVQADEEKDSLSPLSSQSSPLSSVSTPSPGSPQRSPPYPFDFSTPPPHADVASDKVSNYKPNTPKNIRRRHSDSDNEEVGKALHKYNINMNSKTLPSQENHVMLLDKVGGAVEIQATTFIDRVPETVLLDSKGNIVEVGDMSKDTDNNNLSDTNEDKPLPTVTIEVKPDVKLKKKSNLKGTDPKKAGSRVTFDPLALLLDASLEGELELVRRCAIQVENVSASNDEGITALHNAICAGHYDIVKFLVEFGCDVNSPDSDGWTPLHCAASCNNLPMVKFLVEHGACIFATTISDHETAAEKCEEDEDGYDGCSEYLYSIQEKLGIMNNGEVFAVFDYNKENPDELDLRIMDKFTVLKKGDEHEREWWWARKGDREGYIPRNLLGLTPRVLQKTQPNGEV